MAGAQGMSDKLRDKTPLSAEPQSCDMEHAQQWFADQGKPSLKLDYPPLVSLAAEFTKARSEVMGAAPPPVPLCPECGTDITKGRHSKMQGCWPMSFSAEQVHELAIEAADLI